MFVPALGVIASCAALALGACGDSGSDPGMGGEPAAMQAAPSSGGEGAEASDGQADDAGGQGGEAKRKRRPPGITITTTPSQFGEILFDADRRAIYLFDKEQRAESECYGECAKAWPPVLTKGKPRARGGAKAGLLGTTKRDDGTLQVTYAGHPLYYYVDDPRGEVLCHNVLEFGGLWLVLQPSGEPVA